jgi:hypothetical protein
VLLLSNSQGRGPEVPAGQIYPALLSAHLSSTRAAPVRVVNWSFASNRVPEAIVLLARARELNPHLVVAAFPPNWFSDRDLRSPLTRLESDLTETAWLYRGRLPERFRERYLTRTAAIRAAFARGWPLYRYRDLPVFALSVWAPGILPVFPEASQSRWFDVDLGRVPRMHLPPAPRIASQAPSPELMAMFLEAASELAAPKAFVLQPLWFALHPRHERAAATVREGLERGGWITWDLTRAVPWDQYFTESVHFTPAGHVTFAEELSRRLDPLLPSVPGP